VWQAISRVLASLAGFSGKHSLSAECGARLESCRFCAWLCSKLSRDHCLHQAKREGLVGE
jgi:hypothetical protein